MKSDSGGDHIVKSDWGGNKGVKLDCETVKSE